MAQYSPRTRCRALAKFKNKVAEQKETVGFLGLFQTQISITAT
jgi:hypothetical protein